MKTKQTRPSRQSHLVCQSPRLRILLRQNGSAVLEFALVATLLSAMVFGIMEGGQMLWTYNAVAHACRQGARYATVNGGNSTNPVTSDQITTFVESQAVGLNPANFTVTVQWQPDNKPGSFVQVQATYQYTPTMPLFNVAAFQMGSTARMVITH